MGCQHCWAMMKRIVPRRVGSMLVHWWSIANQHTSQQIIFASGSEEMMVQKCSSRSPGRQSNTVCTRVAIRRRGGYDDVRTATDTIWIALVGLLFVTLNWIRLVEMHFTSHTECRRHVPSDDHRHQSNNEFVWHRESAASWREIKQQPREKTMDWWAGGAIQKQKTNTTWRRWSACFTTATSAS